MTSLPSPHERTTMPQSSLTTEERLDIAVPEVQANGTSADTATAKTFSITMNNANKSAAEPAAIDIIEAGPAGTNDRMAQAPIAALDPVAPSPNVVRATEVEASSVAMLAEGALLTEAQPHATEPSTLSANQDVANQAVSLFKKLGIEGADLSYAEFGQLVSEARIARQLRQKAELKSALDGCATKAVQLGVSKRDLISRLKSLLENHDMKREGTAKQASKPISEDTSGKGPEVGKTYEHPKTGNRWTKTRAAGSAPKKLVECIHAGALWADLLVDD